MQAVELRRSRSRYLATRAVVRRLPSVAVGDVAPLRLVNKSGPEPTRAGWARVRPRLSGICGSDLATVTGSASLYLSPVVSLPCVLGHEVVGDLLDDAVGPAGEPLAAGTRVVLDPLLGCVARGLTPCPGCAEGRADRCDSLPLGHLAPGLQTGFCADTGGGWSEQLVAHGSQLRAVPEAVSDERAVLVEPLACAVHTAMRAQVREGDAVLVVGAGSVGLLTLVALRHLTPAGTVTVVAKHRRQQELARALGADEVVAPSAASTRLRRATRSLRLQPERGAPFLLGGVDVALDCAGSSAALDLALRSTRAGGRVVASGMPTGSVDLTPLWFRELELVGAYATSREDDAGSRSSFDIALDLVASDALDPLEGAVDASWPLDRWREALDVALDSGRLATVKTAFDLRRTA